MAIASMSPGSPQVVLWAHLGICFKFISLLTAISGSSHLFHKASPVGVDDVPACTVQGAGFVFLSSPFSCQRKKGPCNKTEL